MNRLAPLFGDARIAVAEMDPRDAPLEGVLFPEEALCVERAVLSRRQQFSAGRLLARQALAALGLPRLAVPADAQRVPVWPSGVIGTITHTQIWCGAALARSGELRALGADVELATPLELGLWDRICRPEERSFLRRQTEHDPSLLAKAWFSAKESIYKALYPGVRTFLDFQGMRIELGAVQGAGIWPWHAVLQTPWGPFAPGTRFGPGRLSIDAELITSAVAL
jgi:4'-phosphopantetheinyl transferase EntD